MIVAKLQGGHSNQLFQYATGRALASRLGVNLYADTAWFGAINEGDTRRVYELDRYALDVDVFCGNRYVLLGDESRPSRLRRVLDKKARRKGALVLYRQQGHGFDPRILELPDNSYLEGWWQDERYFKDIRSTLIAELELREPPTGMNAELLRQIRNSVSISVHVRRGDYVTNPAAHEFHGVLTSAYYEAALARMSGLIGRCDQALFVFSDDIAWCRRHFDFSHPTTFVDAGNSGAEDMWLMKQCNHHIVANSSFSWWGAWLCEYPAKVVIAPAMWFNDVRANAETEIVPPDWVRL